jgi:putative multiple sugar transport system substrate-binding protein
MFNRRTALASLAGAASLALTVSACGQSSVRSSEGTSESGTVGVAMPTRSSDRWLTDGRSIVKDLKDQGYQAKLVYGDDDPKAQVSFR